MKVFLENIGTKINFLILIDLTAYQLLMDYLRPKFDLLANVWLLSWLYFKSYIVV